MEEPIKKIKGKIHFESFYRVAVNCLKLTGLNMMPDEPWSDNNQELIDSFFYYYKRFWFFNGTLLLASFTACMFVHLDDPKDFTKVLTSIFTSYFNYYKGCLMWKNEKEIKDIMRALREYFPIYEKDQKENNVGKVLKVLLRMKKIYVSLYLLLVNASYIPMTLMFLLHGEKVEIFEFWIPFALDSTAKYVIYFLWSYWISATYCMCGVGSDFMFFSTITLLCLEFESIKEEFKKKINEDEDLKILIDKYDRLIQLSNDLHAIFENYLFFYISQSSIIVGLICFQLVATDDFLRFIPYLFVTLNQLWLLCYFGQKLLDSSSSISMGIFESSWFNVKGLQNKKNLIFIIQRSQKPKIFNARGYATITLETFKGVRKKINRMVEKNYFFIQLLIDFSISIFVLHSP